MFIVKSSPGVPDAVVSVAEDLARGAAMADRKRYQVFLETVEKFVAENGLIIGGASATRALLADIDTDPLDWTIEVFCDGGFRQAKTLAQKIYEADPDGLGHYTTLLTRVPNEEFVIVVDGRDLVKIRSLSVHRGVQLRDAVMPSTRPARFVRGLDVLYLGPEIQLMGVYTTLCDPSQVSMWGDCIAIEARLRSVLAGEMHEKIKGATGITHGGAGPDGDSWYARRQKLYDAIKALTGRVLIGDVAVEIISKSASNSRSRIQFITANSFDEEKRAVAALAAGLRLTIDSNVDDPRMPTDARLRKLTLYVGGHPAGKKDPIAYFFNAGSFELVPWMVPPRAQETKTRIGTPFVLMRFRLVEMWTIQLLARMGQISPKFAAESLFELVHDFETIGKFLDAAIAATRMEQVFPKTNFIGRLENAEIARKRLAYAASRKSPAFHPPMYPARNKGDTEPNPKPHTPHGHRDHRRDHRHHRSEKKR